MSSQPNAQDIVHVLRQLASMQQTGIPLLQSLSIIADGCDHPLLQQLVNRIKTDVKAGSTLQQAFSQHPKTFKPYICQLIGIGEQTGKLDTLLNQIAEQQEKQLRIKASVKKALLYPSCVVVITFIVSLVLLLYVVPQFESIFASFNHALPAYTQAVITLSKQLQQHSLLFLSLLILFSCCFIIALKRSTALQQSLDRCLLKLPLLGNILRQANIARLTRTLSITLHAGIPLLDGIKAITSITTSYCYQHSLIDIRQQLSSGKALHQAMATQMLYPNFVTQMINVGEQSGSLDTMLLKIAKHYETNVSDRVENLTNLLEPILMATLGVVVGGLVVAMYLPIFKLGAVA